MMEPDQAIATVQGRTDNHVMACKQGHGSMKIGSINAGDVTSNEYNLLESIFEQLRKRMSHPFTKISTLLKKADTSSI